MPVRRILLTGIIALVASSALYAQRGGINLHDHLLIKELDLVLHGRPQEDYEGSPFLNDNYVVAYVIMGAQKFDGVPMRYDMFNDRMEFQDRGQLFILDPDPRITRIEMGQQIFVVKNFKHQTKKEDGFLEMVETGKAKLFAKKIVSYRAKLDTHGLPAKYYTSPDNYYIQVDDQPLFKVTNVKSIVSQLSEKQDETMAFARKEKISTNDRGDLSKLVAFYNSLFVNP